MKKITFIIIIFFISFTAYCQKELWGVTRATNFSDIQGNIVKFDINGENATTVHHFNYTTGKLPSGKLFLASNGKLYGTATYGGIGSTNAGYEQDGNGVLYEYDLTFDSYRVVHYFNGTFLWQVCPTSGLIEPLSGKLYGGTLGGGFYVYDIATETVSYLNHTYSFDAMGAIYSDLIKASNSFVYAVSAISFPCTAADPQPNRGTVIKINTATNTAQRVASFSCVGTNGEGSNGVLIEALPNRIFFCSGSAYQFLPDEGFSYPAGTIVEFNTLTNTLTRKITFDVFNSLGFSPNSFVLGDNGNLYGTCNNGGNTYVSPYTSGVLYKTGTLFEYNPNTNAILKLTEFLPFSAGPGGDIIKLSTGDLMGNLGYGSLFKYNIIANSLQFPDTITYSDPGNQFYTQNLIEICRKPSYQEIIVNTFDGCVGSTFTYDVQNTNATSYQWQQNNINVAGQTTGVLNLTNLTTSNAGNYICVMSNECGETTTMALHLTVNCLGTNTVAALEKSIKLYPNPTNSILNIDLPTNIDVTITSLKVIDLLGNEVLLSTNGINKIDVSDLSSGIYIISLVTNYGNWNGKFVKK